MAGNYNKYIVDKCKGCVRIRGKVCGSIIEPKHFWDNYGKCIARIEDQDKLDKLEQAMASYRSGEWQCTWELGRQQ